MTVRNKFALCVTGIAIALCMMVVGVLAVMPQTISMKGTIDIDVPDRTLYLRDARVQYGDQEPTTVQGFRKGYINKNFQLKYDINTDSDTIKLYFDIVNLIIDGQTTAYKAETSWTDGEVSGASFNIDPNNKTIAAGTVNAEDFTSNTPISGTIVLEININNSQNFDLSNITILIIGADKTYLPSADYTIDGDNITINGIGGASGDVDIPEKVSIAGDGLVEGDDYTVTSIGDGAFKGELDLETVTLPDSITSIGSNAFNDCTSLTTINFPEGLTEIGDNAFNNCTHLTDIVLPNTLKTIGSRAFYNCNSVSGTLNIPASVENIEESALSLMGLEEFTVDEDSNNFVALDGVLYSKDMTRLIVYPRAKVSEDFVIPQSVTVIDAYACASAGNIYKVTLPNNLQIIGDGAFYWCNNLTDTLEIPASVTSIGSGACSGSKFTAINVDAGNSVYASENGVLYNKAKTTLILYPRGKTDTNFVMPNTVTRIAYAAFHSSALTTITFSNSLTYIDLFAFYDCLNLTGIINLPSTITGIATSAFSGCVKLTEINIDNDYYTSVDGVVYNADMTSLVAFPAGHAEKNFIVPDGVEGIGMYTFYRATLSSITIPVSVKRIGSAGCRCGAKTVIVDSPAVAAMLQDKSASYAGGLLESAITVYILDDAADSLPDRFFTMFSETSSDRDGYRKYTAI